ncbi:hypothetical protein A7U60_g1826 [Sanghuangporus baumii]|uniref:Uncharacterized protein n=1 Tax=Sanghuangporus baumii TaxID=108892 RepID=A0A9Q5NBC6_SANBA|nr:hypothetical protein A7U60_g1826 [Sanghuangporus baumii]
MRIPRPTAYALRPTDRYRPSVVATRLYASKPTNGPRKPITVSASPVSDPPTDPRPRWMFSTAAFLRITLVPVGLIYAIFYHDFGEEDHVFMPPRRWLQKQKDSFFALTPAEKDLVTDAEVDDGKRGS